MSERALLTLIHVLASAAVRDQNIAAHGSAQGAVDTANRLAAHLNTMPNELDCVTVCECGVPRELKWRPSPSWITSRAGGAPRSSGSAAAKLRPCWQLRHDDDRLRPGPVPGDTDDALDGEILEMVATEPFVVTQNRARHPAGWHGAVKPGRGPGEAIELAWCCNAWRSQAWPQRASGSRFARR